MSIKFERLFFFVFKVEKCKKNIFQKDEHYNNLYYALPLLLQYNFKANLNIVGCFCNHTTTSGDKDNPNYSYLTFDEIKFMHQVGKVGKLECDFILRDNQSNYSYVQIAYTILESKDTEDREYKSLESITWHNYPKYLLTTDTLLQKRNGVIHTNLIEFIKNENKF